MKAPYMTITELSEAFRANQIPASEQTVGDMICAGKFPFAVGLDADRGHKRRFLISRAGAYQWIEKFTGRPAIQI